MINRMAPYLNDPAAEDTSAENGGSLSRLKSVVKPIRNQIVKRPREALALSLVVGVVVGWLAKRR